MSEHWFAFEGRMGRKVYFFRFLIISITFTAGLTASAFLTATSRDYGETLYSIVYFLGIGVFACANSQRLHDLDKSGWWQLAMVVPYAGFVIVELFSALSINKFAPLVPYTGFAIVVLVLIFRKGTDGTNRFGPDPSKPQTFLADS